MSKVRLKKLRTLFIWRIFLFLVEFYTSGSFCKLTFLKLETNYNLENRMQ